MASLFISYSRRDIAAARKMTDAFKAQGLDFWIDWEGIPPTVDWWREIEKGIEEADIFLFLISPDSASSKVCTQEIEHARKNGKRLIPVVVRDLNADETPSEFRHLNWIFLRESDDFPLAFGKLITAIKTDYEWVQVHRELLVKALEWERNAHEDSFLLFGKELQEAENELAANSSKEPHPTDLQREYVHRSRRAADQRRARNAGIATVAVIVLAALAIFGFLQAGLATANARKAEEASTLALFNASIAETQKASAIQEANGRATAQANAEANQKLAEERAKIALARQLAGQALNNLRVDPERSILLALQAIATTHNEQTKDIVAEAEDALHQAVQASHVRLTLRGHTAGVNGVAFSPDGKRLATTSADGTAKIWDVSTGKPLLTLTTGHVKTVTVENVGIAFSPDGKRLATASAANTAQVWDTTTGEEVLTLTGHTDEVTGIAFSPDGMQLATASFDTTTKVWDSTTGQELLSLQGQDGAIWAVAFSPDGKRLASANNFFTADIWDTTDGKMLFTLKGHQANVIGLAFSPDGTKLATASLDGTAKIWAVSTGEDLLTLTGHGDAVNNVVFSPNGKWVATASSDRSVKVWDSVTGKELFGLVGHTSRIGSLAFSPDGTRLATASDDTTIKLWSAIPDQELMTVAAHIGDLTSIAFSPDGRRLAAVSRDGFAKIWDTDTGQEVLDLPTLTDLPTNDIAFSPDGKLVATANWSNTATIWDSANGNALLTVTACFCELSGGVIHVAFSPEGMRLVTTSVDGAIKIWDVTTGQELLTLKGSWYSETAFSPSGMYLANSNTVWDTATGQEFLTLAGQNDIVWDIAFSPDGTQLATASRDETAKLWDAKTGQLLRTLKGHSGSVSEIAFSPDGQQLITQSGADHTVRIWNITTGEEMGTMKGNNIDLGVFALDPAGRRLAIEGSDETIQIYVLPIEELIQLARSRLTRTWTSDECKKYLQLDVCPPAP